MEEQDKDADFSPQSESDAQEQELSVQTPDPAIEQRQVMAAAMNYFLDDLDAYTRAVFEQWFAHFDEGEKPDIDKMVAELRKKSEANWSAVPDNDLEGFDVGDENFDDVNFADEDIEQKGEGGRDQTIDESNGK